jgi:hypothetical protein
MKHHSLIFSGKSSTCQISELPHTRRMRWGERMREKLQEIGQKSAEKQLKFYM